MDRLRTEHDGLPAEGFKRLDVLHQARRSNQLERYLDRFTLGQAKIPGVGAARVTTLASYGIHTASDLVSQRLLTLPGFGPATVSKLLQWRRALEASFRFDPSQGVHASETAMVEREIAAKRARLEREVSNGLARLKTAAAQQSTLWRSLEGRAAELTLLYAQAIADAAAAPADKSA